jgi:hypothetical protein
MSMKARHSLASCNLQAFSETLGTLVTGELLQRWVHPHIVADLLREEKGLRSNVVITAPSFCQSTGDVQQTAKRA